MTFFTRCLVTVEVGSICSSGLTLVLLWWAQKLVCFP